MELEKTATQVRQMLKRKGWHFRKKRSKTSSSIYFRAAKGYRTARIRIADHPVPKNPKIERDDVDVSLHPKGHSLVDLCMFLDGYPVPVRKAKVKCAAVK